MFSAGFFVPNPYQEVYPFPTEPSQALVTKVYSSPADRAFRAACPGLPQDPTKLDIETSLQNLKKLEALSSGTHPAVLYEKLRLASLCYLTRDYKPAEDWLRDIVKANLPPHLHSLQETSRLLLAWTIRIDDKHLEATVQHRIANPYLTSFDDKFARFKGLLDVL